MTTTLITGANKGLGFETARQLVEAGHTVYIGSRDERRGKEAADKLGARSVVLDVTSDESVAAAVALIRNEAGHLDVLVNNAGIAEPHGVTLQTTAADAKTIYDTNVLGVIRVTHAFLPLLQASDAPVIVNVSSSLGSISYATDPGRPESAVSLLAYNSSKAALNMITVQYARVQPQIKINVVDPGYTATDLNDHRGTQTVAEGAAIIVRMATIGADGPTGGYFNTEGSLPW